MRRIMKDFTFSNGVHVPAGTIVVTAAEAAHFDEVSMCCFWFEKTAADNVHA